MKQLVVIGRIIRLKNEEIRMIKEVIIGLVILAYVIPFLYIFIADIADVIKRIANVFSQRLKPALIVISKTFLD
jgi:Na+/alanine symporter